MLEKEEKEFLKLQHDEHVAENNLSTIRKQFKSAQTNLSILQEKKKKLDELRREMMNLLNDIKIPIDQKLEENFKKSQIEINKIVKVRMQYEQASCHVDSAKCDLYSSILLLSKANEENSYSMYDPFCYPGYLSDSWVKRKNEDVLKTQFLCRFIVILEKQRILFIVQQFIYKLRKKFYQIF